MAGVAVWPEAVALVSASEAMTSPSDNFFLETTQFTRSCGKNVRGVRTDTLRFAGAAIEPLVPASQVYGGIAGVKKA